MSKSAEDLKPLIHIVDDDEDTRLLLRRWLERAEMRVCDFGRAEDLMDSLKQTLPDAICLDLGLPGIDGLTALRTIRERHKTVPVIILTGSQSVDDAVDAMQSGAYDYIQKPGERSKVVATVENAVEKYRMVTRLAQLEQSEQGDRFGQIYGRSPQMIRLFKQLIKVAASDISVLLHGESGTGKELVANALHEHSARSDGPFVAVNCAAVAETLQDSEFFGHEKGAFTGAGQRKIGRIEQAHNGTLFLDEVAELDLNLQAKLLRVLQEKQFHRVGGTKLVESDFRVVAASHKDLSEMVKKGQFREDLFYRLAVLELSIPPLREREGDVLLLARQLLSDLSKQGQQQFSLSPEVEQILHAYQWPGNVRELRNVIQRAVVIAEDDMLMLEDLPERLTDGVAPTETPTPMTSINQNVSDVQQVVMAKNNNGELQKLRDMNIAELERWAIETALTRFEGSITKTLAHLEIGRTTLYRKMKEYGLKS